MVDHAVLDEVALRAAGGGDGPVPAQGEPADVAVGAGVVDGHDPGRTIGLVAQGEDVPAHVQQRAGHAALAARSAEPTSSRWHPGDGAQVDLRAVCARARFRERDAVHAPAGQRLGERLLAWDLRVLGLVVPERGGRKERDVQRAIRVSAMASASASTRRTRGERGTTSPAGARLRREISLSSRWAESRASQSSTRGERVLRGLFVASGQEVDGDEGIQRKALRGHGLGGAPGAQEQGGAVQSPLLPVLKTKATFPRYSKNSPD